MPGLTFSMLAMALAAGAQSDARAPAPIQLVAEAYGEGVQLRVTGASEVPYEATYALEVSSNAQAGGNRSVQRGNVTLQPGVPVTLMTLTLGNVRRGGWSARLVVEPKAGPQYEEVRGSEPEMPSEG